jgi:hypothetical protein
MLFRNSLDNLGNSREIAEIRFFHLEKRLAMQPDLSSQYIAFMKEYQELNHMEIVPNVELNSAQQQMCYLQVHHPVLKSSSSTTRVRVIFDASAKKNQA